MNIKFTVTGALVASGLAVAAWAHGGATGIVKERMDGMSTMGKSIKALVPMMQGRKPLEPELVRAMAAVIQSHSGENMLRLFPHGSGGEPSKARAEIWQNQDGFARLANRIEMLSRGLALAAENPLRTATTGNMTGGNTMMGGAPPSTSLDELAKMPVDGVFTMLTRTCAACHTRFRSE